VQIDSLALRMRPRTPFEAADLGARLCQSAVSQVYVCYALVAVPMIGLALASYEVAPWLPTLVLWWSKPWLDRTILFVLARAAFGQRTAPRDLWESQRDVWWRQLLLTWTWRRLSPWRSFTQPVYQLEGIAFTRLRSRVVQIRRHKGGPAFLMTAVFSLAETVLAFSIASLAFWFAPPESGVSLQALFAGEESALAALLLPISYSAAVLFLEPFYVAAGFAMYLNRRAELEAWDIEQELRRAFAH
jgi:hypothetical protein